VLASGYIVVDHLRRGHRLDVYDVWSDDRECRCVAKTLRPERAGDEEAEAKLRSEGAVLAALTHPHLVRAYETVECRPPSRPAVILEMLPGETLAYLIDEHRRLPLEDVAVLGLQLASALAYLHRYGWLHLDVKPSNIVATGGRAVLLDLSLAAPPGMPTRGGTYDYLSPEQATGGVATVATDVWGLGATLYEALAGVPPFADHDDTSEDGGSDLRAPDDGTGDGPDASGRDDPRRSGFQPPSLRERGRFPRTVVELIDACLEPARARRPRLDELAAGLAHLAGQDHPVRRPGPVAAASPGAERNRR
jgi:serine/threonine protein kinase